MRVVRNAADALTGTEAPRITIAAALLSNCVTIDITDNGPGFPEVARKNLFKPFKGSARAVGTGLGLSIARDLIAGHACEITPRKSDESGTTFQIEFPEKFSRLNVAGSARYPSRSRR